MGSNLQRVLGLMTPESVNAIVEHGRNQNREDILATNTSIDADKKEKNNPHIAKDEQSPSKDQEQNMNQEKEGESKLSAQEEFQNTISLPKKEKKSSSGFTPGLQAEVIEFDKTKINEINKKAKQKSAISSYQSNIVPNYLKGTARNDLQGLLVNKKCG